ncbi:MAG: TlyA family RNA methyltransferase [Ruminococcaceae bacterium]|nr:TlyA family RNA methyltransferase [Oscillospiraceae bacterium]
MVEVLSEKIRLDVYLAENNPELTREKAKSLIMSGVVYVDNQKCDKAGTTVTSEQKVEIRGKTLKYVSRGGLKLEKSVDVFNINLEGMTCMDIGASTGGFTDVMLQNGAKKVYAIDVGYGQLAWKLRTDERVVCMERTNIRYVKKEDIPDIIDFFSVDVSFISLKLVLPVAFELLKDGGLAVVLIKPQFEAGREKVGKKGVVRDKNVHVEVVEDITAFAKQIGFGLIGLDFSPIKGPEGNIEYLLYMKKGADSIVYESMAKDVVEKSHQNLDK